MTAELARVETGGQLSVQQVLTRMDAICELMKAAMKDSLDYGTIPGTGGKPTLLKPGAEKLCVMFCLNPQYETHQEFHADGHLTVRTYCTVYHTQTETRLGGASALCSTRESKYAYRNASRTCPGCGKAAIIKGKEEFGGGWLCWKKKDGCGATFAIDDGSITGQVVGRIANPDLPDSYNTVLRIAEKRALVAAVRQVTGASAIFDEERPEAEDDAEPTPAAKPAQKPQAQPSQSRPQGAAPEPGSAAEFIQKINTTDATLVREGHCKPGQYFDTVKAEAARVGIGNDLSVLAGRKLQAARDLAKTVAEMIRNPQPPAQATQPAAQATPPAAAPSVKPKPIDGEQLERINQLLVLRHGPHAEDAGKKLLALKGQSRWSLLTAEQAEQIITKLEEDCDRFDAAAQAAVDAAEANANGPVYDAEYVNG